MVYLKYSEESCQPVYMTKYSAGADLKSRVNLSIEGTSVVRVPTGVWIDKVLWDEVPKGGMPEIQIRARSGLAWKQQLMLANGVGTIDVDYREEIQVLLYNAGNGKADITKGMRIAQLVLNLTYRIQNTSERKKNRQSGFGSTGNNSY